ncbi:MAG: threonine--tRNA ligase [Eubacteriales bacterium]|nr:threonine--tRNA ligase [Eubacteriales bacterium]
MISIIDQNGTVKEYDEKSDYALSTLRHSASHIMAQAIKRLYPNSKLAIGPSINNGFYYDIDFDTSFLEKDLEIVENEMKKIIKEKLPITRQALTKEEALNFFNDKNEIYKIELINDLPETSEITIFSQGEFCDLCAGPHITNTSVLNKSFKLTSLAGAYWRGSEKNKMLTRIYGTAFFTNDELDNYLTILEEAKKRDHRKIGKELSLFMMNEAGPGFPFFLPNGMILRNSLMDYWKKIHKENGYLEISSPIILSKKLWETSGHWDHYKENMYTTIIDDEVYAIKPMNCPGSILIYKNEPRSYKDLPLRLAECGIVHRHEKSGELHGLMRVREFTQDDAHIYITNEQIEEEVKNIVSLYDNVYNKFGFKYEIELSTRPDDRMGSDIEWDNAENGLKLALNHLGLDYKLNEGDGAFYGPKIDFHLSDCLNRKWQCGTIQLDFQLPQRFNLEYIGSDGEKHQPIMIHRTCLGSVERFIGILIEHFMGAFPTWLSPIQVEVIPISDKTLDYANDILNILQKSNIRSELDDRSEKMGFKIREAQVKKIPYMIVVGPKEKEEQTISLRSRFAQNEGSMSINDFIEKITKEINNLEIRKNEKNEI